MWEDRANVALAFSVAALVVWIAAFAAEFLYVVMVVLAAIGLVLGLRAGVGEDGRAIAAVIIGAVLVALFLGFVTADVTS